MEPASPLQCSGPVTAPTRTLAGQGPAPTPRQLNLSWIVDTRVLCWASIWVCLHVAATYRPVKAPEEPGRAQAGRKLTTTPEPDSHTRLPPIMTTVERTAG